MGDGEAAMTLIDASTRTDPWEHAVAACLRAWAHLVTGCPLPESTASALALARLAIPPTAPGMTLSRTRLGLTAAELATTIDPAQGHLLSQVADDALQDGDGHAAREPLRHPAILSFLTQVQHQRLRGITAAEAAFRAGPALSRYEANCWQVHPQQKLNSARPSAPAMASRQRQSLPGGAIT